MDDIDRTQAAGMSGYAFRAFVRNVNMLSPKPLKTEAAERSGGRKLQKLCAAAGLPLGASGIYQFTGAGGGKITITDVTKLSKATRSSASQKRK